MFVPSIQMYSVSRSSVHTTLCLYLLYRYTRFHVQASIQLYVCFFSTDILGFTFKRPYNFMFVSSLQIYSVSRSSVHTTLCLFLLYRYTRFHVQVSIQLYVCFFSTDALGLTFKRPCNFMFVSSLQMYSVSRSSVFTTLCLFLLYRCTRSHVQASIQL